MENLRASYALLLNVNDASEYILYLLEEGLSHNSHMNSNSIETLSDPQAKKCIVLIRNHLRENGLCVKSTNVHVSARTSSLDGSHPFVPISITGFIDAIVKFFLKKTRLGRVATMWNLKTI